MKESAPKLGCTHAQVRVIPFLWLGLGRARGDDRPTNANGDRAREARGGGGMSCESGTSPSPHRRFLGLIFHLSFWPNRAELEHEGYLLIFERFKGWGVGGWGIELRKYLSDVSRVLFSLTQSVSPK